MSNVVSFPQPSRKPLYDLHTEHAVLGCVLKNSKSIDGLQSPLKADFFYEPGHARLFDAIMSIHKRGGVADVNIVARHVASEPWFDSLGGRPFLDALRANAAHPRALDSLCTCLKDYSLRRSLLSAAEAVTLIAEDIEQPIESTLAAAENVVCDVAKGTDFGNHWVFGDDLVKEVHYVTSSDYSVGLIPTGIQSLDAMIGGIRPGKMTVFAARASMGKSTVALALTARMAAQGYGVALFSLEMDRREVAVKIGCLMSYDAGRPDTLNPSPYYADRGELYDAQKVALVEGATMMRDWHIAVDERSGLNPSQIRSAVRGLVRMWDKAGVKPGAIIVDHLHVVKPENDRNNRVVELGEISGFLTELAKETGIAVIAMCQLNREVENRGNKDKRPQLSDLRGSGKIEEDAYAVAFIYRPEYYLRQPEDVNDLDAMLEYEEAMRQHGGKLHFIVEKNRGGPRGECVSFCSMKHSAVWG